MLEQILRTVALLHLSEQLFRLGRESSPPATQAASLLSRGRSLREPLLRHIDYARPPDRPPRGQVLFGVRSALEALRLRSTYEVFQLVLFQGLHVDPVSPEALPRQ